MIQEFSLTVWIIPETLSERLALRGFPRCWSPWWDSGLYRGTMYWDVQDVVAGSWRLGVLKIHPFARCWRKTVQRWSDDLYGLVSSRWGDFPRSASLFFWWTTCFVGDWQESLGRERNGFRNALPLWILPQIQDIWVFAGDRWDGCLVVTSHRTWAQIRDVLMTSQLPQKWSRRVGRRVERTVGRTSLRIWPPILDVPVEELQPRWFTLVSAGLWPSRWARILSMSFQVKEPEVPARLPGGPALEDRTCRLGGVSLLRQRRTSCGGLCTLLVPEASSLSPGL